MRPVVAFPRALGYRKEALSHFDRRTRRCIVRRVKECMSRAMSDAGTPRLPKLLRTAEGKERTLPATVRSSEETSATEPASHRLRDRHQNRRKLRAVLLPSDLITSTDRERGRLAGRLLCDRCPVQAAISTVAAAGGYDTFRRSPGRRVGGSPGRRSRSGDRGRPATRTRLLRQLRYLTVLAAQITLLRLSRRQKTARLLTAASGDPLTAPLPPPGSLSSTSAQPRNAYKSDDFSWPGSSSTMHTNRHVSATPCDTCVHGPTSALPMATRHPTATVPAHRVAEFGSILKGWLLE
ncbi:hypothetical protein EDD30_6755 [Couchioplanes caeruleus]|uniref:Uncharacterized protein n=1 Tax=Couchioplanes caeruleus TaxID=56438 RepID=A0A3N1GTZ8_9ACTN|nr:hypothetical protein EDD30_6755 [Couchioplanes caeruleus]